MANRHGRKTPTFIGFYSVKDLMRIFDISRPTIYHWVKTKKISEPDRKLPNGVVYWSEANIKPLMEAYGII
jgi:predicted DNA-binding transcriptional regulator AlpA